MDTPSQKLGARIIERLVSEKLLDAEAAKKLRPKLEAGKLRAEDWRIPIETAATNKDKK
jgi:hypothetical protein